MLNEIVNKNLDRIESDLSEIIGLKSIDFLDIFPVSEDHKIKLDEVLAQISTLLQKTDRGNVYYLNTPIKTKYGDLKYIKIRFFDKSRLNWEAAADFVIEDRNVLLNQVGKDNKGDLVTNF